MRTTRREVMKRGLLAGSTLLLSGRPARAQWGGGGVSSPPSTPFQVPLPIPPVLQPKATDATTDYYDITMKAAQKPILPDLQTTIWGYEGLYPGPTIVARSGRAVAIRLHNQLPVPTSTHLHGGHTPPDSDGHPDQLIVPGGFRDYYYPNGQIAAPLWYHDHAFMNTPHNVIMGLAGFYILTDDFESSLNLPSGSYDIGLAIQDRTFNADGSFFYPDPVAGDFIRDGFQGDTILVNGAVQPFFQVGTRKYRFRILNGANMSVYELALQVSGSRSGPAFKQIGGDGGLLPAPVTRSRIAIAPGERVDVVIDFSKFTVGTKIVMTSGSRWGATTGSIMRFDVVRNESDPSTVPSVLRPITRLQPSSAAATRDIELDFDHSREIWVLNGRGFANDGKLIDFFPRLGTTEIWRFHNRSGTVHPMHMHDVMFQVLERDWGAPGPEDAGWKDTVAVGSWDSVSVITRFTEHLGTYVYHCHKLEHEEYDMMGQFQVV